MFKRNYLIAGEILVLGFFIPQCYGQDVHEKSIYLLRNQGIDTAIAYVEKNSNKSFYDYGMELIFLGRTEEALEWYAGLTKKFDDPKYFYGKAWTHWVRNESGQARVDAEEIVNSDAPPLIKARAHFLLGQIHYQNEKMANASSHAEACEQLYADLGKNGGLYLANILQAGIAIWQDQYEEGEALISKALEYNAKIKRPYSKGKPYELRAEIAWLNKDYAASLEYAIQSRDAYLEESDEVSGWHLSARVGLLHAMMGDFQSAYAITKVVEATAKGKNLEKLLMYNHITWIYMDRCKGYDFMARKEEVQRWIEFQGSETELNELLQFIEEISCP